VQVISMNLDLLRIILREALSGDAAAAQRYRALLDRWEERVHARLLPYEHNGVITAGDTGELSRHIVYTVAMAAQDYLLLGRGSEMSDSERREGLSAFLATAVPRLAARACVQVNRTG
jgi:hypothetical protein